MPTALWYATTCLLATAAAELGRQGKLVPLADEGGSNATEQAGDHAHVHAISALQAENKLRMTDGTAAPTASPTAVPTAVPVPHNESKATLEQIMSQDLIDEIQDEYSVALYGGKNRVDINSLILLWVPLLSTPAINKMGVVCNGRQTQEKPLFVASFFAQSAAIWAVQPSLPPLANNTWVEVVHCERRGWKGPMWLFVSPGSGVSVNTGRTWVVPHKVFYGEIKPKLGTKSYVDNLRLHFDTLQISHAPSDEDYPGTWQGSGAMIELILFASLEEAALDTLKRSQYLRCGRYPYLRNCTANDRSMQMIERCSMQPAQAYAPHALGALRLPMFPHTGWDMKYWINCISATTHKGDEPQLSLPMGLRHEAFAKQLQKHMRFSQEAFAGSGLFKSSVASSVEIVSLQEKVALLKKMQEKMHQEKVALLKKMENLELKMMRFWRNLAIGTGVVIGAVAVLSHRLP
jgi:hypothetical protein